MPCVLTPFSWKGSPFWSTIFPPLMESAPWAVRAAGEESSEDASALVWTGIARNEIRMTVRNERNVKRTVAFRFYVRKVFVFGFMKEPRFVTI